MKKLLALLICLALTVPFTLAVGATINTSNSSRWDNQSTNGINWDWCNNFGYADYSVQFKTTAGNFNGGYVFLYAGKTIDKNVDIKLYQWNTDLATTKAGTVLDSTSITVNCDNAYSFAFTNVHEPGEYVLVFSSHDYGEYMFFADCPLASGMDGKVAFFHGDEKASRTYVGGLYYTGDTAISFDTVTVPVGKVGYLTTSTNGGDTPNFDMNFFGKSLGVQFKTDATFNAFRAFAYTPAAAAGNTTVTLKLYRWSYNYDNTVAGTALETVSSETFGDKMLTFNFSESYTGEYLVVLTCSNDGSGDYAIPKKTEGSENCAFYFDGGAAPDSFESYVFIDAEQGALSAVSEPESVPVVVPPTPETSDVAVVLIVTAAVVSLAGAVICRKVRA